jgi:pimeloyl-ACP methyl ester carboxylesterase
MNRRAPAPTLPPDFGLLTEEQVVSQLRSGEHAMLLSAVFGEPEYVRLKQLARRASRPLERTATRVYILPGLMGSRLGYATRTHTPLQNVWLNLHAVAASDLLALTLPAATASDHKERSKGPIKILGAMLPQYLKLKLTLRAAGFDARLHAYDWRKGVAESAAQLLKHMTAERSKRAILIGHSMGGLVARAALAKDSRRVEQVIQLGAPNFGSFAPVQALRAVYPSVRKLAALDPLHSPDQLARHVFRSLPGLYEMLPAPERTRDLDFFDLDNWPGDLLGPDATLLAAARKAQSKLGAASDGCHHIVGVNHETIMRATKSRGGFTYHCTRDGDGTVPRPLAEWPDAQMWYIEERHGALPNNDVVCAAVLDLIKKNSTRKLLRDWPRTDSTTARTVSDMQLRRELRGKTTVDRLPTLERRRILEPFISAEFAALVK